MNDAQKEITRIQWDFIKANPKSPVSVDVAQNMVYTAKFSKADMDNLLQAIDPSLRETPGYKQLKESLESIAPIALGEKYKDLELVDENGKAVQLSDYVKPGQNFGPLGVVRVGGRFLTCATCTMLMERGKMPLT